VRNAWPLAIALILAVSVVAILAPGASASPTCTDDIYLKGEVQIQVVQVVWHDDPDWGAASILLDPLTTVGDIPLVLGKDTLIFGARSDADGDPLTLKIGPVLNTFLTPRPVKVEFRLFEPGGTSRRIYLTSETWTLPAATLGDPCNIPGMLALTFAGAVPGTAFQPTQEGWNFLEAEVVDAAGARIADADPENQDGGHSFLAKDTHGLEVLFKPMTFAGSAFGDATFTSFTAGTPRGAFIKAVPYLRRTYPVAPNEYGPRYDSTRFTVSFSRQWLGGLWEDALADNATAWRGLSNSTRDDYLAQLIVELAGGAWAAGLDRVVVLSEPGFLDAYNARGISWSSVNKHVVFVSWNTPTPGKTTAHELGHSYGLWASGTEEYTAGVAGNNGGVGRNAKGYSVEERLRKTDTHCFMGGGGNADASYWIDKPDYRALLDRFAAPRDPEILGVRFLLARDDSVFLNPLLRFPSGDADLNGSEPGDHAIVLRGPGASTLATYPFFANFTVHVDDVGPRDTEVIPVTLRVPWMDGTTSVEIRNLTSGNLLASKAVSSSPPTITLSAPTGASVLPSGPLVVSWEAADADADPLTYTVLWSSDGGATWSFGPVDAAGSSAVIDTSTWPAGTTYRFRVVASDGVNTAAAETGDLTVSGLALSVQAPSAPIPLGGRVDIPVILFAADFNGTGSLSASASPPGLLLEWPQGADVSLEGEPAVVTLRITATAIPAGTYVVTVDAAGTLQASVHFSVDVVDGASSPHAEPSPLPLWVWPIGLGAVAVMVTWILVRRRRSRVR